MVDPEADLAGLERVLHLAAECDGHFPIGEHKYLDLVSGTTPPHGRVAVVDDEIVAYLGITPGATAAMEIAIHPMHRSPQMTDALVAAGITIARRLGSSELRMWVFQPAMVEALVHAGFGPERELRQLRVSLPITPTRGPVEGIVERTFRPGVDEAVWLAVNNAAFEDHPENGSWTREVLAHRMAQSWFRPDGFLMAWAGDDLAGFCWTKPHDDLGEIYVIAVAPGYRGRGLGRRLTELGLETIGAMGFDTAMLYMDADNTTAAGLYGSLGFRLDHVDRSFVSSL